MSVYDKASLVLIPSGTKTSKVYSQKPVNGDGDFTFSRSTAATRVNADGNIEKETQNLLLQSNTFSNAAWSKFSNTTYTVTTETITDPFGVSNSVYKVTLTGSGYFFLRQTLNGETRYITASTYIKKSSSDLNVTVDQSDGDVTNSASNTDWQRLSSSHASGHAFSFIDIVLTGVSGDYYYVSSAQMELGGAARDYIETTTAAVEGGITDNVPRLDYTDSSCPSLKLEPQRTNVLTHSEYFGGWTNDTNTTLTENAAQSPSGFVDAYKLVAGTSAARQARTLSVAADGNLVFSIYAKKGEYSVVQLTDAVDGNLYANFDLENGVLGNYDRCTPSIEDAGDGWYRCIITWTASANINKVRISIAESKTQGRLVNFAGNGTDGIYIYGAQLESGTYETSYIPTYGTSVTRNVDVGYNLSAASVIGQGEGTIYIETIPLDDTTSYTERLIQFESSGSDFMTLQRFSNSSLTFYGTDGTNTWTIQGTNVFTGGEVTKIAAAYKVDDVALYANGTQLSTDTSVATMPNCDRVWFANNASGSSLYIGKHTKVMFFPTRLSNEELAALTTI
jgi:hypothetical protein